MLFKESRNEYLGLDYCGLNPYSNGICSLSHFVSAYDAWWTACLNPYSNGICSLSDVHTVSISRSALSLNPYSNGICSLR